MNTNILSRCNRSFPGLARRWRGAAALAVALPTAVSVLASLPASAWAQASNPVTTRADTGGPTAVVTRDGAASGAAGERRDGAKDSKLSRGDRRFIEDAMAGGQAEVQLGQLAMQRSTNPQVKAFAERMVADHQRAGEELRTLAQAHNVALSADAQRDHQKHAERLTRADRGDFDRAYMDMMVKDHDDTVGKFRKASKSADDPQIKAFATRQLPTLEEHLKMARSLRDTVKAAR